MQQDLVDIFEKLVPTCRKEGQYMHPGPQLTAYAESIGESKLEEVAAKNDLTILARLPIDPELASLCDKGMIELHENTAMESTADLLEK